MAKTSGKRRAVGESQRDTDVKSDIKSKPKQSRAGKTQNKCDDKLQQTNSSKIRRVTDISRELEGGDEKPSKMRVIGRRSQKKINLEDDNINGEIEEVKILRGDSSEQKKKKRLSLSKNLSAAKRKGPSKQALTAVVSEYFSDCTSSDAEQANIPSKPEQLENSPITSKLKNLAVKREKKEFGELKLLATDLETKLEETSDFEEEKSYNLSPKMSQKPPRKRKSAENKKDQPKKKKDKKDAESQKFENFEVKGTNDCVDVKLKAEPKNRSRNSKDIQQNKTKTVQSKSKKESATKASLPKAVSCQRDKSLEEIQVKSEKQIFEETEAPSLSSVQPGSSALLKPLPKTVDQSDVTAVLLHMEGLHRSVTQASGSQVSMTTSNHDDSDSDAEVLEDSDDSDEGDWEDVKDLHGNSPVKSQLPDKPVEITLDAPEILKKRRKHEFDWKTFVRRRLNRYQKEVTVSMHKVHLLCLTARGLFLNNLCQDEILWAQALSVLWSTKEVTLPSVKSCGQDKMATLVKWIVGRFPLKQDEDSGSNSIRKCVEEVFTVGTASSKLEKTLVCVILLRSLGFLTRVVMSLQPLPFKPASVQESGKNKRKSAQKTTGKSKSKASTSKDGQIDKNELKRHPEKRKSGEKSKQTKAYAKKNMKTQPDPEELTKSKEPSKVLKAKNKKLRSKGSKVKKGFYKEVSEEEDFEESDEEFIPDENDRLSEESSREDEECEEEVRKSSSGRKSVEKTDDKDSSGSEFEEDTVKYRNPRLVRKTSGTKNRKIVSSDSESLQSLSQEGTDEWAEVYLEQEKRWFCIDCITSQLNKPYDIEKQATQPVHYVLGFLPDGTVKDVTARYASEWLTETRKLRTDSDWWEETLSVYQTADDKMNEREDREIQSHLMQRPLPTSIAAFKNHPLYALKRHLLKFEAIYPDTAVPLGFIKGEPVYARECVHVLHSRENWLKEGRAVRIGEEAYKFVKSRPKWNKPKDDPEALDLEVFGVWQTEVYIPPPAVDGKVPRNAHGNVELFLPSMLPAGTVHIRIPGLNKVAKKLDIDCAPAMVGWDHHCGFSHPLMDGWIVCEEYKDVLLAAWDEEQEILREKEKQKRERRVYDNWKLLIKGLLIKQRLKKRFDLEQQEEEVGTSKQTEDGDKATDYNVSWPQNRQTKKQHKNMHYNIEKI